MNYEILRSMRELLKETPFTEGSDCSEYGEVYLTLSYEGECVVKGSEFILYHFLKGYTCHVGRVI